MSKSCNQASQFSLEHGHNKLFYVAEFRLIGMLLDSGPMEYGPFK
jgi:hypothetical protein